MKFTTFGKTGITVSRLCLGCMSYGGGDLPDWALGTKGWHVDKEDAREHFAMALEAGINFFDTADVYSVGRSEEITGAWLKEMASRDDVVVATKVHGVMGPGPNRRGLSRKHIIEACENSLRRLQMDYVDLYQIHRWDSLPALEETLDALDSWCASGKVRYLGASSMAAWQLSKALYTAKEHGWHRFVSMQNHYNLVYREEEREMIPLCMDQGLAIIPWSPLARGFLTGRGSATADRRRARKWTASPRTCITGRTTSPSPTQWRTSRNSAEPPPAQIACAWVLQAPGVTAPIIGATKPHHLKELIAATDLVLTPEEVEALEAPYRPHPILGHAQPKAKDMRR